MSYQKNRQHSQLPVKRLVVCWQARSKDMELLDKYFEIQKQIYDHFGYVEDWVVIPLDDCRRYFWHLTGEGPGDEVMFAKEEKNLFGGTEEDGYSNEILPKRVFRAADYTMICVDTHTDGNKFLQIFDNAKERPEAH